MMSLFPSPEAEGGHAGGEDQRLQPRGGDLQPEGRLQPAGPGCRAGGHEAQHSAAGLARRLEGGAGLLLEELHRY